MGHFWWPGLYFTRAFILLKMFKLTSDSDEGFSNRSKDIFAGIDDLAKTKKDNCKEDSSTTGIVDNANATEDKQKATLDFKGRESIFRSPNETGWLPPKSNKYRRRDRNEERGHSGRRNHPPRRGHHKTPDHVANPNKYTKYSLSDVSKDQISGRSNTRAAFDFLRELKDRKDHTSEDSMEKAHEKSSSHKVTFKKPNRSHQEQQQPTTSVVHDGVKRVMPECVVGQKRPKENEKLPPPTTQMKNKKAKKGLVSLSHLDDDEVDDV